MRRIRSRAGSWLVAVTAMLSPVSMSFAAQNGANTVNSAAIIAADGASGQTLTTGSGVKTGHIQDGAVTAAKLGMVCANGEYLQYVFGSGWVCSVGTAGPQGPQGPIGVTGPTGQQGVQGLAGLTGPVGPIGPQGQTGPAGQDGTVGATGPQGPAGVAPHYANVIVVAKSGGDYTDFSSAVNSISDASASNRYLIKVMPGEYLKEGNSLLVKGYVDIEGSGKGVTVITANDPSGVLSYYNNSAPSQIRNISLVHNGPICTPNGYSYTCSDGGVVTVAGTASVEIFDTSIVGNGVFSGVKLDGAAILNLNNVSISADNTNDGTNHSTMAGVYGVYSSRGVTLKINNSTIDVKNGYYGVGISNFESTLEMKNTTIKVTSNGGSKVGVDSFSASQPATAKVYNSTFINTDYALKTDATGTIMGNAVEFNGSVLGNVKLLNCFDNNFVSIPNQ